jgi:hypothetical protein
MDRRLCNLALISVTVAFHVATRCAGSVDALLAWMPLRCPLRMFTGIECPTCGLGHAIVEAFVGEWDASWEHHPAGIVVVLSLIALSLMPRAAAAGAARLRSLAQYRRVRFAALLAYTIWGFVRG